MKQQKNVTKKQKKDMLHHNLIYKILCKLIGLQLFGLMAA